MTSFRQFSLRQGFLWHIASVGPFTRLAAQDVSDVYAPISWDCFLNGSEVEHTPSRTKSMSFLVSMLKEISLFLFRPNAFIHLFLGYQIAFHNR